MVIRNYFVLCLLCLFLFSFVSAEDSVVKGKLYDNANLLEKDALIQGYLDRIAEETGAVIIIYLEDTLNDSDLVAWGSATGKRMGLGDVGDPNNNILIGYFKEHNAVYVTSKSGGKVKYDLKFEVSSLISDAIEGDDESIFLDAVAVLGRGLGVPEGIEPKSPDIIFHYTIGVNDEFRFRWNSAGNYLEVKGNVDGFINTGDYTFDYTRDPMSITKFKDKDGIFGWQQDDVLYMLGSNSYKEVVDRAIELDDKRLDEDLKISSLPDLHTLKEEIFYGGASDFSEDTESLKYPNYEIVFKYLLAVNDEFTFRWNSVGDYLEVKGNIGAALAESRYTFDYTRDPMSITKFKNKDGIYGYEQEDILYMLESNSYEQVVDRALELEDNFPDKDLMISPDLLTIKDNI
jgi:hypothetical protein